MKVKSIVVILVTLVIGFVLGMLTSAQIRYHRLKPVRVFFSEQRFREGFYRAIQPDDRQKAKIDLILDKYAKINTELQNNFRKELDSNMKEFRREIDQNLTKEQQVRLKEMDDRRQQMIRQNRRNHENDTLDRRSDGRHNPEHRQPAGPAPHMDNDTTRLRHNK